MRLFIGVELSDAVKAALAREVGELSACGVDARWTKERNFHVTMQFLGEVDPGWREEIARSLAEVAALRGPFTMTVVVR